MSINKNYITSSTPYIIQEGIYGATFSKNGESLFLRMELLTEANTKCWACFKEMNWWVANNNSRGVLSVLVRLAGEANYPKHEEMKKVTGFTEEEYVTFTEKAINLKKKTDNKIANLLKENSVGSNHMYTGFQSGRLNYITYITKNSNFSIQDADMTGKETNLKNFIDSYNDILISVGSAFSKEHSFHNRGISRNPYWVFEEKYSGLSMLLHGFSGAVADKYFPEKKLMHVKPVGSMQCIIKKNLFPEEGYIERKGIKTDITILEVSNIDPEGEMNYITVSALKRIYQSDKSITKISLTI